MGAETNLYKYRCQLFSESIQICFSTLDFHLKHHKIFCGHSMCTCLMCALYLSRLVNFESQKSQGIHKFRCFCSICRATIARKGRLNWQTEQDHNFPPSSSNDSVKYSATMSSTNKKISLNLFYSLLHNGSMIVEHVRLKLISY